MPWPVRRRLLGLLLAAAGGMLAACGEPPDDSPQQEVQERLVGTWLREYQEDRATQVRRVLVLQSDGAFREMSLATAAGRAVAEHAHAGSWRFDGTNLKRRYTDMDGQRPSAPIVPFATIELRFQSPDEFIGVDHVHRREMRYRRVGEGTRP